MGDEGLFHPRRMSSWWSVLEDLLYPEKRIQDKIKRRAEKLSRAGIDSVMQFGFHTRFDFAPYFGALHAYHAAVAEELHRYGIRFIEHFSCNVVARPRDEVERLKYHRSQRHHVALYPDRRARAGFSYEAFPLDALRCINIVTGLPSYAAQYQCEFFCHNNPDFREMTQRYLRRYLAEVPVDGMEVDDMAIYDGFQSCGCPHCRERFRRECGIELPPIEDRGFWGDTARSPLDWGNYGNPDFLSWVQMRFRGNTEHFALIRKTVGDRLALTTCSSITGPILLNALGMQYESIADHLTLVMLENNGIDVSAAAWTRTEPEAMLQKSYARSRGGLPMVALSYANCEDGAYLGWAIARFWGVSNWTSTLIQGLPEDPPGLAEPSDYVGRYNLWDRAHGDLDVREIVSDPEVLLVYSRHNKENGYRLPDGRDSWERVSEWSRALLARNVSYEFIREDTLGSRDRMSGLRAPVLLASCAYLSDAQTEAIRDFAAHGGKLVVSGSLGTHDENGKKRERSLGEQLGMDCPRTVTFVGDGDAIGLLDRLAREGTLAPRVVLEPPDSGFVARLHTYGARPVLHLLNTRLEGIPHEGARDEWATARPMLNGLRSLNPTSHLGARVDFGRLGGAPWSRPVLRSPELDDLLPMEARDEGGGWRRFELELSRVKLYAMVCEG